MISTGGSFLSVWRMVRCLTTILPKSAERRKPPLVSPHTSKKRNFKINNRGQVSVNLLSNDQVRVVPVGEKSVLVMEIPRANRRQRPVYVGQNPINGTYRRNYEGDYLWNPDEVGRMLADQSRGAR